MLSPKLSPPENQSSTIPISEAVKTLAISNRNAWIHKLKKSNIMPLHEGDCLCLKKADFERICLEKDQYILLDSILTEIDSTLSPAVHMQLIRFVSYLQLTYNSYDLLFTIDTREIFIAVSKIDVVKNAIHTFFSTMTAPECSTCMTCQQAAQLLHQKPLWLAAQIASGRLPSVHQIHLNGFLYLAPDYVQLCASYQKERSNLNDLLSKGLTINQIVPLLQEQFIVGKYDIWYCGCEYEWYYLRKDRTAIMKVIQSLKKYQDIFKPRMIAQTEYINALYYIQNPPEESRLDPNIAKCRSDYHCFLAQNAADLGLITNDQDWLPTQLTNYAKRCLEYYILLYAKTASEQYPLLLEHLQKAMPQTATLIDELGIVSASCVSVMLHLLLHASADLPQLTNASLKQLMSVFDRQPKADGLYFQQLLSYTCNHCSCSFTLLPNYLPVRRTKRSLPAYSQEQYTAMSYFVFNQDYAQKAHLIEKACQNSRMAEAWLFLALHWVCAQRQSDLQRLPIISLPQIPPKILIEQIKTQQYLDSFYDTFLTRMEVQLQALPSKPNKTKQYLVPDTKIFFPQSLRSFFGMLFLLVFSHRQVEQRTDAPLFRIPTNTLLYQFFGAEFLQYIDGKFSTRRANKSYLQSIMETADELSDSPIKLQGYYLAAIARSHHSDYAEFATTTAIYLKDAKFSHTNPEYLAMQMFERGVLSFIPHMMLSYINGKSYDHLSITEQTLQIQQAGLSPNEIDQVFAVSQSVLQRAQQHVAQTLQNTSKNIIQQGLLAIGSGTAPSKGPHSYCLLKAIGQSCTESSPHCLNCPYEIQTQADLYLLVTQFQEIVSLYTQSKQQPMQAEKYHRILVQCLLPQISQMFIAIQQTQQDKLPVVIWAKEAIAKCLPKLNPQIDT